MRFCRRPPIPTALFAAILATFLTPAMAHAQCSVNVSPDYDASIAQLTVHASASGDSCGWVTVGITVDTFASTNKTCPDGGACDFTATFDTMCWTPGAHAVRADAHCFKQEGTSCVGYNDSKQTTVTTVASDPEVHTNASLNESTMMVQADIAYSFPNTHDYWGVISYLRRKPDGSLLGPYNNDTATAQTGTRTVQLNAQCWDNGAWQIIGYAGTCGKSAEEAAPVTINHKPAAGIALGSNSDGSQYADVTYNFPQNADPANRLLKVQWLSTPDNDGATIYNDNMASASGTHRVELGFVQQAKTLRALAIACGTDVTTKEAAVDPRTCCGPGLPGGGGGGAGGAAGGAGGSGAASGGPTHVGSPVRLWDGAETYTETDPLPSNGTPVFTRFYDSSLPAARWFGTGWTSAFDAWLVKIDESPEKTVLLRTESENRAIFHRLASGGSWWQTWPTGASSPDVLVERADGSFEYREARGSLIRIYRNGRLVGYRDLRTSRTTNIDYDSSGTPVSVWDGWGAWSVNVTTSSGRIIFLAAPGITWSYNYTAPASLSFILAGTNPWRTYELTGGRISAIRDGAGNLIETHTYDPQGRAVSSHGAAAEITNIEYNLPGDDAEDRVTRVTYGSGRQELYHQKFFAGRQNTTRVDGACTSCGIDNATYAHDEQGRVVRVQGSSGFIDEYTYSGDRISAVRTWLRPAACDPQLDPLRCRMNAAGLAAASLVASSATTTSTYAYADPHWPEKPTLTTVTSVLGTTPRTTQTTYDAATGTPLVVSVTGWTSQPPVQQTRTTTTALYSGSEGAAFDPGLPFNPAWLSLAQPAGVLKSVDGPRTDVSDATAYVYYPNDATVPATLRGRLAAVRNAAGHIARTESYDVFGNVTRQVDPNGVATELTYDALGRPIATTLKGVAGCDPTVDALCATDLTTTREYSGAGPLLRQTAPGGGVTAYEYDARGRLSTMSRGPSGSELRERIAYQYDVASGRKSSEQTLAYEGGSWVGKRHESFAYDAFGRLSQTTHADNTSIGYTYDVDGNILTVRDENHGSANTHYRYDLARRLDRVTQDLDATASVVTSYAYDLHGNLTSVTDPNGNVTSYVDDDFGQMLEQTSPVTGVTTYTYDLAGNLVSSTDANGAATTRTYDGLGRAVSATSTKGASTEVVSWAYDAAAVPFGIGRQATMSDPTGSTTWRYERRGLVVSEQRTVDAMALSIAFAYDTDGNRTRLTYPSGRVVDWSYDYAGRPLSSHSGSTTIVSSAAYLPFGPMTQLVFGNGLTKTSAFDNRYRPATMRLSAASGVVAEYGYANDAAGNITAITDAVDATYTRSFGYDGLNRLTSANSPLWGTGSYTYDVMGNMLTATLGTSVSRTFTYAGTTPRLESVENGDFAPVVTYDAAGNEISGSEGDDPVTETREYSPRNQLSRILRRPAPDCPTFTSAVEYGYDGRGVRVVRRETSDTSHPATPTARYTYTPDLHLLAITGDTPYEVLWFGDTPVASATGTTLHYTFTDHLGTPLLQTNSTGTVTWRAEYEPFGNVFTMRNGAAEEQPLRFPGQELERTDATGGEESYNIFRWYRAGWGRYTQADPLAPGGLGIFVRGQLMRYEIPSIGKSRDHDDAVKDWGVGIYSYAADNPLVVTDRVGLKALRCKVFTLVSSASRTLRGKCVMLGECASISDPWDVSVTFGTIYIPSCFSCPKKCTFEAHGDRPIWHDPATNGWDCTPWTPIYRAQEGPLDADL